MLHTEADNNNQKGKGNAYSQAGPQEKIKMLFQKNKNKGTPVLARKISVTSIEACIPLERASKAKIQVSICAFK